MISSPLPRRRGGFRRRIRDLLAYRLLGTRYVYETPLDRQRASAVSLMSLLFGLLGLAGTLGLMIVFPGALLWSLLAINILLSIMYLWVYRSVQIGRLARARWVFVVLVLLVPLVQGLVFNFLTPASMSLSLVVPIVAGAFLLGPVWAFPIALIAILAATADAYADYALLVAPVGGGPADMVIFVAEAAFLLVIVAILSWLVSSNLFAWARDAQRRSRQLEAAIVVSEAAAIAPSLKALLGEIVERIRDAYGFYHAQVFLVDPERRMARLEASTGRAGEALLARGHALPVGSQSVVGECTAQGQPVVVNDVSTSRIHRPNELLPDTRAELALPLIVGSQVIGVLDVQSTVENAFQPDDVRSLQVMAAQLATAIEKTRLLDELQARARENELLLEDARQALRQIEEMNRYMTREGWTDFLRARRTPGTLGYTLQGGQIQREAGWTAPMRQAYQGEHGVVIQQDQQAHIIALPVRIRGEVVGVLEIARGGDQPWSDDEIELAQVLVDRLGLAVENARLFEQATDAAERQRILNRIAQNVQEAGSVEQVLQAALTELSDVLGASRGVVQISPKTGKAPVSDQGAQTPVGSGA